MSDDRGVAVRVHLKSGGWIQVVVPSYPLVVREWLEARTTDGFFILRGDELHETLGFDPPGPELEAYIVANDIAAIVVLL